ncbi:MAG: cyclic nucleotide-binding domain-containing protein [Thermodesulfobacteriota bacterium]|nr:cyclic nucleotide-binding domain-containing protein [Thermodesulfobacteriota bacterium]
MKRKTDYQIDRGLRFFVGIIVISSVFFYFGNHLENSIKATILLLGVYSATTGVINFCPLSNLTNLEKRFRRRKLRIASDITVNNLKDIDFFKDFDEKEINDTLYYCKDVTCRENQILMREGKGRGSLNIIFSGQVKVVKAVTEKSAKTIAVLEDGDIFGEMSFIDDSPPSASIVAVENSRILEIDRIAFSKMMEKDKDLAMKIMTRILQVCSTRVRHLSEQIVYMGKLLVNNRENKTSNKPFQSGLKAQTKNIQSRMLQ